MIKKGFIIALMMVFIGNFAQQNEANKKEITVFTARKIITMNPDMPEAQAVAVKDNKILAVGTLDTMKQWLDRYPYTIDKQFQFDVLVPGFIEAHMHPQITGALWEGVYVGYFDRYDPEGDFVKGCKTKQEVIERIKKAVETKKVEHNWIFAWGYQPEFYNNSPLTVSDLDPVTGDKFIMVENASMHIFYVNSAVLKKMNVTAETKVVGIQIKDGKPTGVLEEVKALKLLLPLLPKATLEAVQKSTRAAAKLAHRVGVTTIADAALGFIPHGYEAYKNETEKKDFPVRIVIYPDIDLVKERGGLDYLKKMYALNNDMLSFGPVKFITDGSIQGLTANLLWPYFLNGKNGIANITLEELKKELLPIHKAGYQAAIHTNGNQATENAIKAIQYVLTEHPRLDHRHRLEHNQLVTESQLERMKTMGIATNFFATRVYYWGDLDVDQIVGYERASQMNPANSALQKGIPFSFHSDASVTPLNPLMNIWAATIRKTLSGKVLGPEQRVSVYDALKAVTLGAAYLIFQEDQKGSIENGKLADFAVLDKDPLTTAPDDVKNIKVKATVLGGKVFPVTKQ